MLSKIDGLIVHAQGRDARLRKEPISSNPYPSGTLMWVAWINAWEWFDKKIKGEY